MGNNVITPGAMTSHGGTVLPAGRRATFNGVNLSCEGDDVTCPVPGHGGITKIAPGNTKFTIDGKKVASQGKHKTLCGADIIAIQTLIKDSF